MNGEIIEMAKREREKLMDELSAHPAYQKLQQINKLIDTYEALDAPREANTSMISRPITPKHRPNSKVAAVDEVVANFLRETGRRASSGELLPVVLDAGIELSGKIPAKTLSALLSVSKKFNNLKGHGYGLAEWGENIAPGESQANIFG